MNIPRLYLASSSPRRRNLIKMLRIPAEAGAAPVDESELESRYRGVTTGLSEYLAHHKALAAAQALATDASAPRVVLGADTTVILDGTVLGKPRDATEAESMLRRLRGRAHVVTTGVAIVRLPEARANQALLADHTAISVTVSTRVNMRLYSDDEIAAYVATGDSLDKAGGYAVQHQDFQPVADVSGCYLSVIGLPVCVVSKLLGAVGIRVHAPSRTPDSQPGSPCSWCDMCRPPLPEVPASPPA